MESNSFSDMKFASLKSVSQYSVSFASLSATFILFKKSALDCACSASLIKAPIAVPLQRSYFDSTYSLWFDVSHLYKLIVRKANLYDLDKRISSIAKI